MSIKRFSCRTHGGVFQREATRGRPPVRCAEDYPCDKATEVENASNRFVPSAKVGNTVRNVPGVGKVATVVSSERAPTAKVLANPGVPLAKAAKERLEALGWSVRGRIFTDDEGHQWAMISASRGEESLIMDWENGIPRNQIYSLFSHSDSAEPELPGRSLKFNPAELTDGELVDRIRGMKVTWWNSLGNTQESAIVGTKVSIEHIYDQGEHHDDSKRLVKFVDRNAGGFRAFHVGALMRVG